MTRPGTQKEDKTTVVKDKLQFKYLPAYAAFLLKNHLKEYSEEQLKYTYEEDVPIMKYIAHLSKDEIMELAIKGNIEFLTVLAENKSKEFIEKSTRDFINNQVVLLQNTQVVAEDITIITFIRRKTLRRFLKYYSTTHEDFVNIMEEVDRFSGESEATSINALMQIQQDNIKRINMELEHRQEDLLEAQELADMGSFLWDIKDGSSIYTPGVTKIFEIEGKGRMDDFLANVHEEDREMVKEAIARSMDQKDGIYKCEYRFVKSGKEKRIWSRGIVTFEDGKPARMKGTIMDITGKYTLLNQLQQSDEANKLSQALTHIGNWAWDLRSGKIHWSDELYRIYGLKPQSEEISFDRFMSLIHPEDRERRIAEINQALETRKVNDYSMRIVNPDGTVKMIRGKGELVLDRNNNPLILNGTCQDITLEHNLNLDLHEKEENLQELINNAPDAVIVIGEDQRISLWNPKAEEIFGWTSDEVIGHTLTETIIPEKYHNDHLNGIDRLLKTGIAKILNKNLELTALNKAGEEFYISITISQSIQKGKSFFIGFIRDITDDKQTKSELKGKTELLEKLNLSLEAKNTELSRINRELESFNYIASHDLQEPLRKIQTFTQLIIEKGKAALPPSTVEYFNKILTSSSRMKLLIEDLLMFSQTTANEDNFELTDLNMVLDEVKVILSTVIEEKKAVIESDELPELSSITFQMQQLLLNLISNAIKYSKENVAPHISISSKVVKGSSIPDSNAIPNKEYYEIKIEDNGIGFEKENAERIFGLFQRLHNKDKYSGTGIGLAICKKIVHNHNGFIHATGVTGKGSTFFVYLPMDIKAKKNASYLVN
jgi:PAS domain S-box-containing protein